MRDFHSASWVNVVDKIREQGVEVVLSGYAYDYLLGDNYYPRTKRKLLGVQSVPIYRYIKKKRDFSSFVLDTISWRYKSSDVDALFKNRSVREMVRAEVQKAIAPVRGSTDDYLDWYNYLTINNLSRHFLFIESSLLRVGVEDRVPGIDNDILDFSTRIEPQFKLNSKLYKDALMQIDSRYFNFVNANTNYPASLSSRGLIKNLITNKIKKSLGLKYRLPPLAHDRSWGSKAEIFKANVDIVDTLRKYREFRIWDFLGDFNKRQFFLEIDQHISGKRINHTLMNLVLGVEHYLSLKD